MGHNFDLIWLLGLPDYIRCPNCKELTKTWFEDYDIDCGEPKACDGVMKLDIYCDHCEENFKFNVEIKFKKEDDDK